MPLAAFAYNSVVHASIGFSPHVLTFGFDPRVPSDLLIGPPSERDVGVHALSLVNTLTDAFQIARAILLANQRRSKDSYETGIVERIFCPGHKVFIRIKNLFIKPGSKLLSPWSGPFEVVETKGVLVKVRDKRVPNGREEWVHHDRLSNPSLFADRARSDVRADPTVDREDPEFMPEDLGTVGRSRSGDSETDDRDEEAHYNPRNLNLPKTTRSGRAVRTNTNPDFDYTGFFTMSSPPPTLNVPTNVSPELARQASQAWSDAMAQQRVCVVLGLQPSPFAFIHRRTGTF